MDYRWSSVRLFCEENSPHSFVRAKFILRMLAEEKAAQTRRYRELLADSAAREAKDALEERGAVPRLMEKLSLVFPKIFAALREKDPSESKTAFAMLSEAELQEKISTIRLGSRPMQPKTREARRFMMEQMVSRGYSRQEIAERFGVSVKTVYNILKLSKVT